MPGKPRTRALVAELDRRTGHVFGGGCEESALDFVCLWLENGQTMKELAADLTAALNAEQASATEIADPRGSPVRHEVTHASLMAHLRRAFGSDEVEARLKLSRSRSAHAMADEALALVDAPAETSVDVSLAVARAKQRNWIAERYNPEAFGQVRGATNVSISLGMLHLQALQSPPPRTSIELTSQGMLPSSTGKNGEVPS